MLKKILSSTIIKLVLAVIAGILLGFVVGEGFMVGVYGCDNGWL